MPHAVCYSYRMRHRDDKGGSKFYFIAIIIVVFYLACFNFNLSAAYTFTVGGVQQMFKQL